MKRLSFGLAVLMALSACTVEQPYKSGLESLSFTAAIEERAGDDAVSPETKTYLEENNEQYQIRWNEGDAISIFFDTYNGEYLFANGTGSTAGRFNPASTDSGSPFTTGMELDRYYAIYPYAESTYISYGVISFEFPATQTYAENSFGQGAGVMCAVTSGPNDTHLTFKNVTGYLKLKIYGGAKVKSIKLSGKNSEILAGPAQITAVYGQAPMTVMSGDATSVTLDCGAGVQTGATAEEATYFYFAIPPTDFTKGFSVEITDTDGRTMTQGTDKHYDIRRNLVQPMAAFKFEGVTPEPPTPEIPELPTVNSGLPVLYVYTPGFNPGEATTNTLTNTEFIGKTDWIADSHAYLKEADGTVTDLGTANIRGRGNTTWKYKKKPYAFKLDKKASLLRMPADKRWDLLANYLDRTRLRNDLALELGRRLAEKGVIENWWTPKGEYVELVINDVFLGNYYLVEHIKIAKNRVAITEMKSTDVDEEKITGGYLLECGTEMDLDDKTKPESTWQHQFYTGTYSLAGNNNYRLPVMIKDPDEDVIVPEQYSWIKNHIRTLQSDIVSNSNSWTSRVDMDSFICWMFVQEVVGNYEPTHPKSAYMHKDRNGKLVMGPLWDFDYGTFKDGWEMTPVYHYSIWYPYMLNNSAFADRVKTLWKSVKPVLKEVCDEYAETFVEGNPEIMPLAVSIDKDWVRWYNLGGQPTVNGDESKGIWKAFKGLTDNLSRRINQMNNESICK